MRNILNISIDKYTQSYCLKDADNKIFLSFSKFNELTVKVATYIKNIYKIKKGQRIAIIYDSSMEFAIIFHALLKIKAIPLPLSDELTIAEYKKYISFIKPDWIWPKSIELYRIFYAKCFKVLHPINYTFITQIKEYSEEFYYYPDYSDDEIGVIVLTSGTNSNPKGVMLKFNGLLEALEKCVDKFQIYNTTTIFQIMPFYHAEGCFSTLLIPWLSGASVLFIGKLNIQKIVNYWKYVYDYGINYLIVLPTLLQTLIDTYNKKNEKYYIAEYAKCGSSFLLEKTREDFENKFHIKIIDVYGSTESNAISVGDLTSARSNGSVGRLTHISEVKVTEENELMVKNARWFAGYLNDARLTAKVFDGIWYKTGDLGVIKNEEVILLGRKDDIINRNGYKISPKEIDEVVMKDTAVFEVFTIGEKDSSMNDLIIVFVVLNDLEKENMITKHRNLYNICRNNLAVYKMPDRILFVDHILLNSIGKPSKKLMSNFFKNSIAYSDANIIYLNNSLEDN